MQYAAVADVGFRPPNQNQLLFTSVHAFEFAVMLFKKFVHRLPHHLFEAVGLGIRIGHRVLVF
ncbi:TPA: hypothetical protein WI724_001642 [Neisseria meningitidis]